MKRFVWILMILTLVAPGWAANGITVQQLKDLLTSLQQAKKTDAEVADELKKVELTEELTKSTMDSLASFVPGHLATEQLYALEAHSAVLAPPATDLPSTPAPDAAAQKALLDKAVDYTMKTSAQLPHLIATRTTYRFQDRLNPPIATNQGKLTEDVWTEPRMEKGSQFIYFIGATESQVESMNGAEIPSKMKDKNLWGANGQIALAGQGPVLSAILQQAQAAGNLNWLRWETVNGRLTAVFSFAVDKKRSHYAVNYCCFPDTDQAGATQVSMGASQAPGNLGSMHTYTSWSPYKATVPYHGEIFVDADSGIVVRLITDADFKPSDVVSQEDRRVDYAPVMVGGKPLIVPVRTLIDTESASVGQDTAGRYHTRRTLFILEYKDYK
jgi:hypothetical protein